MMPGVGLDRGAFHVASEANYFSVKNLFHDHDDDENCERERFRRVMWQKKFAHTLNRQAKRCGENTNGDHDRSDRLCFAVTVRMSFIRRPRRKRETAPNHK